MTDYITHVMYVMLCLFIHSKPDGRTSRPILLKLKRIHHVWVINIERYNKFSETDDQRVFELDEM